MSPRHETPVHAYTYNSCNRAFDYWHPAPMIRYLRALNAIQKASEANFRLTLDTMRTHPSSFNKVGSRNAWWFTVRAGISFIHRRVKFN